MKNLLPWLGYVLCVLVGVAWYMQWRSHRLEVEDLRNEMEVLRAQPILSHSPAPVTREPARAAEPALPRAPQADPPAPAAAVEAMPDAPAPADEAASPRWVEEFDRAMDREFQRLEARERQSGDDSEREVLADIKVALEELDAVWTRMDAVDPSSEERAELAARAQEVMGSVIRLAATDRNLRLSRMAHSLGLTEEHEVTLFISELDQIFRETNLDWSKLFVRGL